MLVRLKKRGEFPPKCGRHVGHARLVKGGQAPSSKLWRGMIIEVEPEGNKWDCGGEVFRVTDYRLTAYLVAGQRPCICSHFLIDDLNAYDSDSADGQAEIGDIAFADVAIPRTVNQ